MPVYNDKQQDTTPIGDGTSIEAVLLTKQGLELVQRAIQESTLPSQKPTIAAIRTALEGILTP